MCFNIDDIDVIVSVYLDGEVISVVDSDKHLGNYISTNITGRNFINHWILFKKLIARRESTLYLSI